MLSFLCVNYQIILWVWACVCMYACARVCMRADVRAWQCINHQLRQAGNGLGSEVRQDFDSCFGLCLRSFLRQRPAMLLETFMQPTSPPIVCRRR